MNWDIEYWNTPRCSTTTTTTNTTVRGSKWDVIGICATAAAADAQSFSEASLSFCCPPVIKAINTIDTLAILRQT